jgi:hypothetical protein
MTPSIPPDRLGFKETLQIGNKDIDHHTQVSTPWANFVKNLTHLAFNNPLFRAIKSLWARLFNKITPNNPEALDKWRIGVLKENYLVSTTPLKVALTFLQSKYPLSQHRIHHTFYGGDYIETPQSLKRPIPNDHGSKQPSAGSNQGKKDRAQPNLSFFPILLRRSIIPNHVICVVYDNTMKRLEIYDSQGADIKNLLNEVLPNDKGQLITLRQMLQDIVSDNQFRLKDAEINQIVSNSNVHQKDSHNCSIHLLDYINRRMQGQSAEEIFGSEKNIEEMKQLRKTLIEEITSIEGDPEFDYDNSND